MALSPSSTSRVTILKPLSHSLGHRVSPLNTWFREQMKEVHGIDISQAEVRATNVHDIQL